MIEDLIEGIACYCNTQDQYDALQNMCYSMDRSYDDDEEVAKEQKGLGGFMGRHRIISGWAGANIGALAGLAGSKLAGVDLTRVGAAAGLAGSLGYSWHKRNKIKKAIEKAKNNRAALAILASKGKI
jgi:hypothetical protein